MTSPSPSDVDGSHIRTLLLTLFYRKMPELVKRGYVYVAQPPLYRIKKGKEERYVVTEEERREVMAELGIGNTELTLLKPDEKTLDGDAVRDFFSIAGRVISHAEMVLDGTRADVGSYLASARAPDMELPAYWFVGPEGSEFVDTKAQMDAILEKLGDVTIYRGNESTISREDADVEVHALHAVDHVSQNLVELQRMGVVNELFRKSETPICQLKEKGSNTPYYSLIEAFDAIQKVCDGALITTRYKGLGEMDPSQLWESTMDPERRTLRRVTIKDALEADHIFTVLMGPAVEPRREFIEKHALEATNLDY